MKANTKPLIELRGVKEMRSLSEETPAYTATIYVDGKPFCQVSNHGQGGPDEHHPLKGDVSGFRWTLESLDSVIAETYPRMTYRGEDIGPSTLEYVCHCMLDELAADKRVKRDLASKVLWLRDGKVYSISLKSKGASKFTREQIVAHVRTKEPDARFLHEMPYAEARQIMERS